MRKRKNSTRTCSEAEEGPGDRLSEVLYDYVVDPAASQPSKEISGVLARWQGSL